MGLWISSLNCSRRTKFQTGYYCQWWRVEIPQVLAFILSRGYIIDACSLERNWVMVNSFFVGGSNERQVPPHYITEVCV